MILQCDTAAAKAVPKGHSCRGLGTQFGEKWENAVQMLCVIKEISLLVLLPILTTLLSGQGRRRGYKRELQLVKGLKGAIYERGLKEINM